MKRESYRRIMFFLLFLLIPFVLIAQQNNSRSRAASLSIGESVTISTLIHPQSLWYRITMPNDGTLSVFTTGRLNTELALYDAQGGLIHRDRDSGEGQNARLSVSGSPGTTFFVELRGAAGTWGGTTLHVQSEGRSAQPPAPVQTQMSSPPAATQPAVTASPPPPAPASGVHQFELRVFELTNIERARHGLQPLIWHDTLAVAARLHSEDMLRNNFLGHAGSDGSNVSQRIERVGITNINGWSENCAAGQRTPEAVVQSWMNSPGHRANILNENRTHLGVGFVQRPEGSSANAATYWTQKFVRFR